MYVYSICTYWTSDYLSVCLSLFFLHICLFFCRSFCLFVLCLSVFCLSVFFVCLLRCLSDFLSICLYVCLSIILFSFCLSICMYVCLSVCLFLCKRTTNDKDLLVRWANGKRIKENNPGFRFPFETAEYIYKDIEYKYRSRYICIYVYIYRYLYIYIPINILLFQYIYLRKTEICFPWSTNDKW
jgi:hypothetical protein